VSDRVLYPSYASAPRLWNLSPLDDQAYGGAIMSEGGGMFLIPLLLLINRWLNHEERQTRLGEPIALRTRKASQ